MEDLVGEIITVYMKNKMSFSGTLLDFKDSYIYLKSNKIIVIPEKNINYYSINDYADKLEDVSELDRPKAHGNVISVSVNSKHLTNISAPPNMNITNPNEEVLRMIWSNVDVQNALRGKVQKSLNYSPGSANIILVDYVEDLKTPIVTQQQDDGSFQMNDEKNPMSNYLTPLEMANRLKNMRNNKKGE